MQAESMWRVTGESEMHRRLKEQALLWAYHRGFRCCAMEVRAPNSSYRIDVAGIRVDRKYSESIVAIFECKQSRGDLFRDNRRQHELKTSLLALQDRREQLERLLAPHYPSLRTSDSLFPEWATFDFTKIDHRTYNQTIQKIVRIQRQLFENTKFDLITRYGLGNLHYLVTIPELVDDREVPLGWGLLEVAANGGLVEKLVPTRFAGIETRQWLERIAKAATTVLVNDCRTMKAH
jgi:hypothetical protein